MATKKTTKRTTKTASRTKAAKPLLYSKNAASRSAMRRKAATSAGAASGIAGSSNAGSMSQSPLYYDYRWSTPDKFYFPRSRAVANRIWREMYIRDPAISVATDAFSELPWSKFDLVGIDDASVRHLYEDMFTDLNIVPQLQNFTKDFLITGELILHHIFNDSKGYWERVISHNPDYVRVEGLGLVVDQPLLWLRPTPEIKRLINSPDPRISKLRKLLPKSIVSAFRMNREVPLDSLNTVYIPRTVTSQGVRGVSLYTRLFRIVMYEDFVVNASLAVAQRNAAPLRIFKLGDAATGWLPTPEDEQQFAEMLSVAESDPMAAIIMHQNVSVELVGVSDRMLLISREWDFIERVKLLGMGVAKSFLVGETSYASAIVGLQTLLERLAALRSKFEYDWIINKICKPVAEMNEFYRRSTSELEHRIRINKPKDERELIIPEIKWRKALDPTQDVSILNMWDRLYGYGIVSKRTFASGSGLDLEQERKNIIEETKYDEKAVEKYGIGAEPEEENMGAAPPPPPPATEGASRKAEIGEESVLDNIIDDLENLTDSENKVHIDDAINVLRSSRKPDPAKKISGRELKALEKFERTLANPGTNLFSGV